MNIYLVILILLAVIIIPNLIAYVLARGSRNTPSNFWKGFTTTLRDPYHKEDESLDELHQRVEKISKKEK